jgi:hypothetical protein
MSGLWEQFRSAILFLTASDQRNICAFGGEVYELSQASAITITFGFPEAPVDGRPKRVEMRKSRLWAMVVGMAMEGAVHAGPAFTLPDEDRVLESSVELERKVEPWCPGDCSVGVPFVASYWKGAERLVFVAAHHAFNPNAPTMRAVKEGFAEIQPKVVILEGFPTVMGENPPPLVEGARRYGAPDADEYGRGEGMYAASTALKRGIPFLGGEPTREEQMQVLKAKGFTDADVAFGYLAGGFSRALRSQDIPDTSVASLEKFYPRVAQNLKLPMDHGGWALDAPSLEEFRRRYRQLYGVDIVGDKGFPLRIDVTLDKTRNGEQARFDMKTRDRHLLGLIEQQLIERHSVLVVFGGSHWATLSTALEERLGTPKVTPFPK